MVTTSEVSQCNRALQLIGAGRISSLTDATAAARACNSIYAELRDEVLCAHEWQFAKARATLARISPDPDFPDATYAYQLPNDCLRPLRLENELVLGQEAEWEQEGDQVLCGLESDVQLHYIKEVTDPVLFSAMFKSCLATRMSSDLAMILKKDASLQKSQLDIYYKLLPTQASTDARSQNKPLPNHNPELGIFARARS